MLVIEMNPRVSRSSALASKATGFPIAKVAAKLAVGYTLDELRNEITGGATPASFEPAIDYVVTKMPRFTFEKFPGANDRLTTQMKSVGEAMAIGRTFQESLQKALRSLETGCDGLTPILALPLDARRRTDASPRNCAIPAPTASATSPTPSAPAGRSSASPPRPSIDPVVPRADRGPRARGGGRARGRHRRRSRSSGCSRSSARASRTLALARAMGAPESRVRARRLACGVHPVYKRVDTCAAEFATSTAYLYSTYEQECEADPTDRGRRS